MITYREHFGKKEEKLKITSPTPPQKEKIGPMLSFCVCWAFPLAT